ncbi:MAG: alpha-hydroxy-acid oxidizing protein [Alphaproteobacteria bacterium]|nr:alpha-hydroxy-acid oxidizing protein [Alphaproteobacteria bacterium]
MTALSRAYNIDDLRLAAKRRLPRGIFEYVDRGTEGETSLKDNRAAFERIRFLPRVLGETATRSLGTTLFGKTQLLPMAIAPMSPSGLLWHEGELALARAAAAMGIPYTSPTESMTALERVAGAGGRLWFQLYVWKDRRHALALLDRVDRAGYEALILTVDTATIPNREFNSRNGFAMPIRPSLRAGLDVLRHPRWLFGVLGRYVAQDGLPQTANHPEGYRNAIFAEPPDDATRIAPDTTWDDVREIRRRWKKPLIVKGILRAEDARKAVELGCEGIVVSNHGARNFDSAIASIDALPAIADAVGDRATVLLDSGIRRGSDIAKAVALGAKAVLVGRAALYGLAVGGEAGARHALKLLASELDKTLGFAGCANLGQLDRGLLVKR